MFISNLVFGIFQMISTILQLYFRLYSIHVKFKEKMYMIWNLMRVLSCYGIGFHILF